MAWWYTPYRGQHGLHRVRTGSNAASTERRYNTLGRCAESSQSIKQNADDIATKQCQYSMFSAV